MRRNFQASRLYQLNPAPADPEPAAELPARRSSHAAPQWITSAPVKPWLPQAKQPSSSAESDTPWWLLDVHSTSAPLDSGSETAREPEPTAPFKPVAQSSSVPEKLWEDANSWSDEFVPLTAPRVEPTAVKEVAPAPPKETIEKLQWSAAGQAVPSIAEKNAQFTVQEAASIAADKVVRLSAAKAAPIAAEKPSPSLSTTRPQCASAAPTPIAPESKAPIAPEARAPIAPQGVAPPAVRQPQRQVLPDPPPPRLLTLSSLLFSTGMQNLGKKREFVRQPQAESAPPQPEIKSEIIATAPIASPVAERVPIVPVPIAPVPVAAPPVEVKVMPPPQRRDPRREVAEVTAQPEFLPPREFVPVKASENTRESAPLSRGDRRDEYDDLQILPSRRGQYKRRG